MAKKSKTAHVDIHGTAIEALEALRLTLNLAEHGDQIARKLSLAPHVQEFDRLMLKLIAEYRALKGGVIVEFGEVNQHRPVHNSGLCHTSYLELSFEALAEWWNAIAAAAEGERFVARGEETTSPIEFCTGNICDNWGAVKVHVDLSLDFLSLRMELLAEWRRHWVFRGRKSRAPVGRKSTRVEDLEIARKLASGETTVENVMRDRNITRAGVSKILARVRKSG